MKILLIHPSNFEVYKNIAKSNIKLDKKSAKNPPIGLSYVAAVLKQKGYDVKILDAELHNYTHAQTVNEIKKFNPDIICSTVTTPLISTVSEFCKAAKEFNKNIITILGGPHISALPEDCIKPQCFDFGVVSEGEYTILELVEELEKGGNDFSKIKGLVYKKNGSQVVNERRELIENLDELPFPARELLDVKKYLNLFNGKPYTIVISSRGCPGQCIFCDSCVTFGRRTRFRSPNNVVDELEEIKNRFRLDYVTFCDDTFTLNKNRTIEICREILRRKLDTQFYCSSRVDTIDEDRLGWLKKAGCDTITFGVESGDQRILGVIKKGTTLDQARKAIELTKKHGIKTHASYVLGIPGETLETINKTIKFAHELDTDLAQFTIATPFPGTELWEIAKKRNLLKSTDFSKFAWYYSSVLAVEGITAEQLKQIQRDAYENYHKGKQVSA